MKFNELHEQERIQYIKDGFVLILEQLAKDPKKLKDYIPVDEPKLIVPSFAKIQDEMSDTVKAQMDSANAALRLKVDGENDKLRAIYNAKVEHYKKVETIITSLKKKEGCVCGSCININITNSTIPPELEMLIDIARKEAEERSY